MINIYVIDTDPTLCARYLDDRRLETMTMVTARILCTVARERRWSNDERLYKSSGKNHPCVLWAHSPGNYSWLYNYFKAQLKEYKHRFDKDHKSIEILPIIEELMSEVNVSKLVREVFAFRNNSLFPEKSVLIAYKDTLFKYWLELDRVPPKWTNRELNFTKKLLTMRSKKGKIKSK
jgi:hypothetical protein